MVGLALDELELASLRGTVKDAAVHVNFDTRMGRGKLNVTGPRFSGFQARDARSPWDACGQMACSMPSSQLVAMLP